MSGVQTDQIFVMALIAALVILFLLGFAKSRLSYANWVYSGFESLFLGTLCAVIAYSIGYSITRLIEPFVL